MEEAGLVPRRLDCKRQETLLPEVGGRLVEPVLTGGAIVKSLHYSYFGLAAILLLMPLVLAASTFLEGPNDLSNRVELTPEEARAAINAMYEQWGQARVNLNKKTLDSIMAPDFYVSLYGQRLSRERFLSDISRERPGSRLTRFDTEILTVQKKDKEWTVVIAEKLEVAVDIPDAQTQKAYSYWVTRDGWRNNDGTWLVTYSEAIGHENWKPGPAPPIRDW